MIGMLGREVACDRGETYCTQTSSGSGNDDDFIFCRESRIGRGDSWVDIATHALGELIGGSEHVHVESLFCCHLVAGLGLLLLVFGRCLVRCSMGVCFWDDTI